MYVLSLKMQKPYFGPFEGQLHIEKKRIKLRKNSQTNSNPKQLFIQADFFSFIFNWISEIIIVQTLSIKVAIRNLHSHLTFQSIHFLT